MQDERCPICRGIGFAVKYHHEVEPYKTVQCIECGFVFLYPYPSDALIDRYNRSDDVYGYFGENAEHYGRAVRDRGGLIQNLLDRHQARFRSGAAVDVGAGIGIAVAAMKAHGFDAIGLETNPNSPAIGKKLFDVQIVDRQLDALSGDLKLLTIFEVLEHIKYPVQFVSVAKQQLAEGALMIGSVPNYNGIGRYLHGTRSIALIFPVHLNQFTKASLRRTLMQGGLEVLYIGFPPPYGVSLTLGARKYLMNRFGSNSATRALVTALTALKKYVLYPPLNLFAETTGLLGHGLVFAARKAAVDP